MVRKKTNLKGVNAGDPKSQRGKTSHFYQRLTLFITISYFTLSFIDVLYDYYLYGRFGLNYFDFASIDDFLMAAFRNLPVILVLTVIFIGFSAIAGPVISVIFKIIHIYRWRLLFKTEGFL